MRMTAPAPGPNTEPVVTFSAPSWLTATPPGKSSSPAASSVFVPPCTAQRAPIGGAPQTPPPGQAPLSISRPDILPPPPQARSITEVKPVATVRHGPVFGLSGSQTAFVLPGSMRQILDAPFGKGKPFSSETYHAPSGPIATAVGTASTGTSVPGGGPGNGSPSGHGASSGLKRAPVVILLRVSTFSRSFPAASATRTPPPRSSAS